MTFEDVLARLSCLRFRGSYVMARCPAHDDRVQSLKVSQGDDGKLLMYCHAGCSFTEVLAALSEGGGTGGNARDGGLDQRPPVLASPLSESAPKPADILPPNEWLETYFYTDERGDIVSAKVRGHNKGFFWARYDAKSPTLYYWGLGDTRRVPYRLPRVLDAVKTGRTVYIVEGEKDVHAVERARGVGTCNPDGASKGKSKWKPEWNEYFRGAFVVIVPDQDEAGFAHAENIKENLRGIAKPVIFGKPLGGNDTYDHLEAGYTLEQLYAF